MKVPAAVLLLSLLQALLFLTHRADAFFAKCDDQVQPKVSFKCKQRGACHLGSLKVSSQQACYDSCYRKYECKCALYRPSDHSCHMKTKTCNSDYLGVRADPQGQFTAITMCFHCHKTPKWYVMSGMLDRLGKFTWTEGPNGIIWNSPNNAACTCNDQTGWICTFNCGNRSNPASLAATNQNCDGRSCRSSNDLCMYVADAGQPPEWRCMPQNPVRNKICRTYANGLWDGDITYKEWSCAWYPGRKVCEGIVAKLP